MRQTTTIQKSIALALLLTLALATAPKHLFHRLLADHRDAPSCGHRAPASPCIHSQGFQCHFDDLVVTLPFVAAAQDGEPVIVEAFPPFFGILPIRFSTGFEAFGVYRGPPPTSFS